MTEGHNACASPYQVLPLAHSEISCFRELATHLGGSLCEEPGRGGSARAGLQNTEAHRGLKALAAAVS